MDNYFKNYYIKNKDTFFENYDIYQILVIYLFLIISIAYNAPIHPAIPPINIQEISTLCIIIVIIDLLC